jgi:hypothetical protein
VLVNRFPLLPLLATVAALAMVAALLVALSPPPEASATPAAPAEEAVELMGRVFPDPHGCVPEGTPTKSPHAKGEVCAAQFIQWEEALQGMRLLEQLYPRYVQVINLNTQYGDHPAFTGEDFQSAGLPQMDLSRDRRDLYVLKVTDRESPVPESERRHFVYSLAIHGIERAGLEGGLRAAEDLATWAACENGDRVVIDCGVEGAADGEGRRLLDPFDEDGRSPTAGEALGNGVVYFTLSNPDGWARGDYSEGGVFYQRYNGHGMDLNRDWPTIGYSDPAYTSWSEPETRGFGRWLKWVSENRTSGGDFAGGIDLHGMVTASALSYTLLGAGQKDYRKNQMSVDTSLLMWRDAEERLTWSPHVARADECPGPIPEPFFGQDRTQGPMCTVQWGTVWDTIEYQITGGMGDWMDAPIGLGGVGINNEMALSHLAPNNIFEPDIVQLQIEGNKSLIYSQMTALLFEEDTSYEPGGRIAYIDDPSRVQHDGEGFAVDPEIYDLPTQGDIEGYEVTGAQGFEFVVEDHHTADVFNGGMTIEATFANVQGVSPSSVATLTLEYCGRTDDRQTHQHSHEVGAMSEHDEDCEEIASYFNQSPIYLQAGAQIELNRPEQGLYRISSNFLRTAPTRYHVRFSRDDAIPGWDDQEPYDVSRTDFFRELNDYVAEEGEELAGLSVADVVADPSVLRTFDTVVIADRFQPEGGEDERPAYAEALRDFVASGGNLVLPDGAVTGLSDLAGLAGDAVARGVYYAGYIDFHDGNEPTFERHALTVDIEKDGTASGRQTLDGTAYHDRRQTYEPVPVGYLVGGPSTCTAGCDAPIWTVDRAAWEDAGGLTLGRSYVRPGPEGGSGWDGVSLGELSLGDGVVRVIGGLLPEPTQDNFHPYGLSSYALTYTGYQLFENATTWANPGREEPTEPEEPGEPAAGVDLDCMDCEIEVRSGESGAAGLEVTNTGDDAATFTLAVEQTPERTEAGVTPDEVTLAPGESEEVTLTVETARNARQGTHEVVVSATDGEVADTTTVALSITRGQPPQASDSSVWASDGTTDGAAVAAASGGAPSGPLGLAFLLLVLAAAVLTGLRRPS